MTQYIVAIGIVGHRPPGVHVGLPIFLTGAGNGVGYWMRVGYGEIPRWICQEAPGKVIVPGDTGFKIAGYGILRRQGFGTEVDTGNAHGNVFTIAPF